MLPVKHKWQNRNSDSNIKYSKLLKISNLTKLGVAKDTQMQWSKQLVARGVIHNFRCVRARERKWGYAISQQILKIMQSKIAVWDIALEPSHLQTQTLVQAKRPKTVATSCRCTCKILCTTTARVQIHFSRIIIKKIVSRYHTFDSSRSSIVFPYSLITDLHSWLTTPDAPIAWLIWVIMVWKKKRE